MYSYTGTNLRKINRKINNRRKKVRSICTGDTVGDCRTICASYKDVTACRRDCNDCWDDIDGNIRTGGLFRNGVDDCDGDGDCDKLDAAQKRQNKRDQRRFYDDPYRSQDQEIREQMRKQEQAFRRNHPPTDPNDTRFGDSWYVEKREARRYVRCDRTGDVRDVYCLYIALYSLCCCIYQSIISLDICDSLASKTYDRVVITSLIQRLMSASTVPNVLLTVFYKTVMPAVDTVMCSMKFWSMAMTRTTVWILVMSPWPY